MNSASAVLIFGGAGWVMVAGLVAWVSLPVATWVASTGLAFIVAGLVLAAIFDTTAGDE